MWNLSPFREVNLFHRKMPTVPALEISWNFNIFSKFISSNLQTYLFTEIVKFEHQKLTYFIAENIIFQHFFKVHQVSSSSSSETCMWNLSPFREVNLFHRKMPTVPALEISWNFNIFSKFIKFDQTCRTYWNHHQKHACEIWAHSEK